MIEISANLFGCSLLLTIVWILSSFLIVNFYWPTLFIDYKME